MHLPRARLRLATGDSKGTEQDLRRSLALTDDDAIVAEATALLATLPRDR